MSKRKFVTYYRVSTQRQGRSGLGLEAQQEAVRAYLGSGGEMVQHFTEVESGRRSDRPELAKALAYCQLVGARLLVAKLDRLARNVHFISGLMESGVEFVAADMPEANELTVHIMAAMAQYEAKAISERTRAALAAAKARGTKLGAPSWEKLEEVAARGRATSLQVRRENRRRHAKRVQPVIEAMQQQGKTLREIADALNEIGSKAPRGGRWQANTVSRVLAVAA